jgi:hypothetical protein
MMTITERRLRRESEVRPPRVPFSSPSLPVQRNMTDRELMCARRFLAISAALLLSWSCPCGADDDTTDTLLDQVATGFDANTKLIQRGIAKYRIVETFHLPVPTLPARKGRPSAAVEWNGKPQVATAEMTVYFDYPYLRFDWRGQRRTVQGGLVSQTEWTIYGAQYKVHTDFISKPRTPSGHRVFIDRAKDGEPEPNLIHPRGQACGPRQRFGADAINRLRGKVGSQWTIGRGPDDLVRLALEGRAGRTVFWLSPAARYSVVRSEIWRGKATEANEPYIVYDASFRKTDNGAFVLEHRLLHEDAFVDGVQRPSRDEEVTLLDINMPSELDPDVFTLDGLGLPAGARIVDRVSGTETEYDYEGVPDDRGR